MFWLALFLLMVPPVGWPKVFDCFPFFNEFQILQIRLNELNDVVDYFVLVESVETQRGGIKPLYFEENQEKFAPYLHKIIHVALRDVHPPRSEGDWWREHHQRECIHLGLKGKAEEEDLILISDVDEIPRRQAVEEIKAKWQQSLASKKPLPKHKRTQTKYVQFAMRVHQPLYKRRLNWFYSAAPPWYGTVATDYGSFKKFGAQFFRNHKDNPRWPTIQEGGWHFSSAGPNEMMRSKSLSVVEGGPHVLSDEEINASSREYLPVPITSSYPPYVLRHYEELVQLEFIDPIPGIRY